MGLTHGKISVRRKEKLHAVSFIARDFGRIGVVAEGGVVCFFCRKGEAETLAHRMLVRCNNVTCIREAFCRLSVDSTAVRSAVEKSNNKKKNKLDERCGVG